MRGTALASRVLLALSVLCVDLPGVLVHAYHNFTIDDTNLTAIAYVPETCSALNVSNGWQTAANANVSSGGAYNNTIRWCDSLDVGAISATVTFTGVAVYIMSPMWPYDLSFEITIDSELITQISVRDPAAPFVSYGPVSKNSSVVWGKTGLNNTQHTMLLSNPNSENGHHDLNVDAFVVTAVDPGDESTSTSPNGQSTVTVTGSPSSTSPANASVSSSGTSSSTIALAVVLGIVALCFIALLAWFIWSRNRTKGPMFDGEADQLKVQPYPPSSMGAISSSQPIHPSIPTATSSSVVYAPVMTQSPGPDISEIATSQAGSSAIDAAPPSYHYANAQPAITKN